MNKIKGINAGFNNGSLNEHPKGLITMKFYVDHTITQFLSPRLFHLLFP